MAWENASCSSQEYQTTAPAFRVLSIPTIDRFKGFRDEQPRNTDLHGTHNIPQFKSE